MQNKRTEDVEIIATLFAVWNDALLDGRVPTDDEMVVEVRENWHIAKERFSPETLKQWLGWMREHGFVPKGKPPRTVFRQGKLKLGD
ncbi:hypothetical protein [Solimonas flava]|uniref:hypothetical protein n=1 Tax=Solimonas flava TaxID=415849 RepID=UPI000400B36C|nr:hypothetical protein [Solimonas flava]